MDIIEQIKHLWWNCDSWECILMKIIKGKWIFKMLFLSNWLPNMAGIFLAALLSKGCTQIIAWFAFSVKFFWNVVALRRSVSIIPCIIVLSFVNIYYEYFCKLMWLSEKSLDVLELLNITRQCKIRFLDIKYELLHNTCMFCLIKFISI